jgi:hypothetical protein
LRIGLAAGVALLLVIAGLLAFALTRPDSDSDDPDDPGPSSSAPATPTVISGVRAKDFDPLAKPPTEFPALAGLAVDGDPETAWHTQTYFQQLGPKGLKSGIGMILDLNGSTSVTSVDLRLKNAGGTMSLYVTDTAPKQAPTAIKDLEPVQSLTPTADQTITLVTPVTGRFLTIWFTALPQVNDGFRLDLAEATVHGNTAN